MKQRLKSAWLPIGLLVFVTALIFLQDVFPTQTAHAAGQPVTESAKAGSGGVTAAYFVKLSAAGVVVPATSAQDKVVGVCELTATANSLTRYAPIGTFSTVTSGGTVNVGDIVTCDSTGRAVTISSASANQVRVCGAAYTASSAPNTAIRVLVTAGYVNAVPTFSQGSSTKTAGAGAVPVTNAVCNAAIGSAGAEAWTLANGTPGQVLQVTVKTVGSGTAVITPATKTGFSTITLANVGDKTTLMYVDDTIGWILVGLHGVTTQPAYAGS